MTWFYKINSVLSKSIIFSFLEMTNVLLYYFFFPIYLAISSWTSTQAIGDLTFSPGIISNFLLIGNSHNNFPPSLFSASVHSCSYFAS